MQTNSVVELADEFEPGFRVLDHEGAPFQCRERRVAFAFDPKRRAILLAAGDKSGASESRFHRGLIQKADQPFGARIARLGKAV
jgi:hypothetical protein